MKIYAKKLFIALALLLLLYPASALTEVTALEKDQFVKQTGETGLLDAVQPKKDAFKVFNLGEGKRVTKTGFFGDIVLSSKIENINLGYYITFSYGNEKVLDLFLINHKKSSQSSTTGLFDFMLVDYMRNLDGTERIDTSTKLEPKKYFLRVKEDEETAVTIPGIAKIGRLSVDESFAPAVNGKIETLDMQFEDSYYNNISVLIDKRKNQVVAKAQTQVTPQTSCASLAECLSRIDKKFLDEVFPEVKATTGVAPSTTQPVAQPPAAQPPATQPPTPTQPAGAQQPLQQQPPATQPTTTQPGQQPPQPAPQPQQGATSAPPATVPQAGAQPAVSLIPTQVDEDLKKFRGIYPYKGTVKTSFDTGGILGLGVSGKQTKPGFNISFYGETQGRKFYFAELDVLEGSRVQPMVIKYDDDSGINGRFEKYGEPVKNTSWFWEGEWIYGPIISVSEQESGGINFHDYRASEEGVRLYEKTKKDFEAQLNRAQNPVLDELNKAIDTLQQGAGTPMSESTAVEIERRLKIAREAASTNK